LAPQPNIVFIFADQLRAQSVGFMGNGQVRTPNLDSVASQGAVFETAVSCCPVCTPYRAALLTGRYPLSTGMVLNDVRLPTRFDTIAERLGRAGYATGYIGKWHLDGPERGGFTPKGARRQGFEEWAVANCTHNYMGSFYFRDEPEPIWIDGYDADHHTDLAVDFIQRKAGESDPFCLFVSWGPPHGPYQLMPEEYKVFDPEEIELPPNCSLDISADIAGYYSHMAALDRCFGRIDRALADAGIAEDTILVFTSDHGDMLGSQGRQKKQRPWDESIRVPFLIRQPGRIPAGTRTAVPFNVVDIMPTLLSLSGVGIPGACEGQDLSHLALGHAGPEPTSAFLQHPCTFADARDLTPWRGIRTERYTYIRNLEAPWLLYDNHDDPYQLRNLVASPEHRGLRADLEDELRAWLEHCDDDFQPEHVYWERFGYEVDAYDQIPYTNEVQGA
jgi:arylsulfatase A-like enzyme